MEKTVESRLTSRSNQRHQMRSLILFLILAALYSVVGLQMIFRIGPTFDEPIHLASGVSYWKTGEYTQNIKDHPPVAEMWAALGVLPLRPSVFRDHPLWESPYRYADFFYHSNRIPGEQMLRRARIMIFLLSPILAFVIFRWANEFWGSPAGLVSSFFYMSCSSALAHSGLVTTDFVMTFCFVVSLYWIKKGYQTHRRRDLIVAGVFAGLALGSKFSAILLLPIAALLGIYEAFCSKSLKPVVKGGFFIAVAALGTLLLVYHITDINLYGIGLKNIFSYTGQQGRSAFFMGQHSTQGWLHYFLAAFLIKTPLPLLAAFVVSSLVVLKSKQWQPMIWLFIPIAIFLGAASVSKLQIGLRHILPIYPLVCIAASAFVPWLMQCRAKARQILTGVTAALLLWQAASFAAIHPYHLAYFNESIGGPKEGYWYLVDSNLDWGQGIKDLGDYVKKEKINSLYLSYFGTVDPHIYGIKYRGLGFVGVSAWPEDQVNISQEPRIFLAISATNLQNTYYVDKHAFDWLKAYKPAAVLGHSLFVYDLTNFPKAHESLIKVLEDAGRPDLAEMEKQWIQKTQNAERRMQN